MGCKDCDAKGLGSTSTSKTVGVGSVPFFAAISQSPVLAYAWALGLPFVPFHINIRCTFDDTTGSTSQVISFEGNDERLNVSSLIDQISYQIDAPNYNAGISTKPISDFYFQRQSGIQATMIVAGAPRYVVAPFFTPLEGLLSSLAEGWPGGWVLDYTQSVTMQFQQAVPLPSLPTTVTVTFRLWQPGSGQALDLVGLTNDMATAKLTALLSSGQARRTNGLTV
jgi:hypothetical protein